MLEETGLAYGVTYKSRLELTGVTTRKVFLCCQSCRGEGVMAHPMLEDGELIQPSSLEKR